MVSLGSIIISGGILLGGIGFMEKDNRFLYAGVAVAVAPILALGGYRIYESVAKPKRKTDSGDVYISANDAEDRN